jgi:hypothetical protein
MGTASHETAPPGAVNLIPSARRFSTTCRSLAASVRTASPHRQPALARPEGARHPLHGGLLRE